MPMSLSNSREARFPVFVFVVSFFLNQQLHNYNYLWMVWVRVNAQVGKFLEKAFKRYVFFRFTVIFLFLRKLIDYPEESF